MPRQPIRTEPEQVVRLTNAFNEARDCENDWQKLLKGILKCLMEDFIRLQHPSTRDEAGVKEAFQLTIAALYDDDWTTEWPGPNDTVLRLSFRELLSQRFGITEISKKELQKIPLEPLRKELISEALEYWVTRKNNIVAATDFVCFDGEAYSVWPIPLTDRDGSSVDRENKILYVKKGPKAKANSIEFLNVCLQLVNDMRDLKLKKPQIDKISEALWELLRMNGCFRDV